MGRNVDVDDLVGTAEIAERLGLSNLNLVHDWRRRYEDFPEPIAMVSSVHVWLWTEIRTWAEQTGRLRQG